MAGRNGKWTCAKLVEEGVVVRRHVEPGRRSNGGQSQRGWSALIKEGAAGEWRWESVKLQGSQMGAEVEHAVG